MRQMLRSVVRTPLFALASVFTLTLGVGATTAMFAIMNAVLFRPLPYAGPDRLVVLRHSLEGIGISDAGISLGTYYTYRRGSRTLVSVAAYTSASVNLSGVALGADAQRVLGAQISSNLLPTLGVGPIRGRGLMVEDERPNTNVALISEDLWRNRFGAKPDIVGTSTRIDGALYQVVGVMPRNFHYPDAATQIWRPLQLDSLTPHAGPFNLGGVARLAPGATAVGAEKELNRLLARLPDRFPDVYSTLPTAQLLRQSKAAARVRGLQEVVVGPFARILWIIAAAVALLLAATCANVANLLLVRSQGRSHELAVRVALGAGRSRILLHLFAESGVLAAMSAPLAVVSALAITRALVRFEPSNFPRLTSIHVDGATMLFTIAITVGVAVACGAVPAARFDPKQSGVLLREGGRGATGGRARHRAQRTLIVLQIALAVVLLAGSAVLGRSVRRLNGIDPGFDPSHTLVFMVSLPEAQYAHAADVNRFYAEALRRLSSLPGVTDAGIVSKLPLNGGEPLAPVYVERMPPIGNTVPPVYPFPLASAGYFRAMRIPLVAGRLFSDPTNVNSASEVVVSRAFAVQYWHDSTGRAAIGQRLKAATNYWSTIVGVVESVRDTSLESVPIAGVYLPLSVPTFGTADSAALYTRRVVSFVLRTRGDPTLLAGPARRELHALDPSIPTYAVEALSDVLARASARTRFVAFALGFSALITLVLGVVGLYGVVAYTVSLRRRELGLRMALGATPRRVVALVVREGVLVAAFGVAIGIPLFLGLAKWLTGLLFGISATDPVTILFVGATLLVVSISASMLPALRAAAIDPLEALRSPV